MSFYVEKSSDNTLKITFSGKLDVDSVAKIWQPCVCVVREQHPNFLVLDFKDVDYCDGAGIALIEVLQRQQLRRDKSSTIHNLNPNFQKFLEYVEQQHSNVEQVTSSQISFPEKLGYIAVDILKILRDNITFLGVLSYQLFFSLLNPKKICWADFFRVVEETGPQAVPIVALIGFLIGLISTFQAAPSFADYGLQIYMVNLVGLGLVREMGPLLTAVLLSGRTASAFAAEIGTMQINQEIDALKTMGIDPIRFLVIPRILAAMIVTPILEVFFIIFGLLGSLIVMLSMGYTADAFYHQLYLAIAPLDYIGGMIKVFAFGLVIAGVGCLHGIKTRFGAQAVGRSTTQAVVSSLIMLVVVDGVFAFVYYVLGI